MTFLACTTATYSGVGTWPIIKQLAFLLGYVMRGIFIVLDAMGIHSIALCVVLFTVITRLLLMPLTVRQQKFSKMTAIMNPELQAIQKKYAGKKDNASMQRMQIEQQLVYEKYGVSMSAGCLPSLLQIVLLFALYPVIYNLEQHIPQLANFSEAEITAMYTMFGIIDLKSTPTIGLNPTILIPILAAAAQFASTQLMMKNQPSMDENNAMASSMKTMNYMMPLMSLVFCFSFPCFIGVYWIVMSVVMLIQQIFINKYMNSIKIEDLIAENIKKQNKKRAKKGLPPLSANANMNTKNMSKEIDKRMAERQAVTGGSKSTSSIAKKAQTSQERDEQIKESTAYYEKNTKAKPGSLAAKAGMVKAYNEKHDKK